MVTITEMRRKNKEIGHYFFQKGNPRVEAKVGNYLITKGMGEGYVIYGFNTSRGDFTLVDNPSGDYSWQPFSTKAKAVSYARSLK